MSASYRVFLCILSAVGLLAVACGDEGSNIGGIRHGDGGDTSRSDGALGDGTGSDVSAREVGPGDGGGDGGGGGDGAGRGDSGTGDGGAGDGGIGDGTGGDVPDGGFPDGAGPDGGDGETSPDATDQDTGPYSPFAPCDKSSPCPFQEEPFCVIITEDGKGVCTRECTPVGAGGNEPSGPGAGDGGGGEAGAGDGEAGAGDGADCPPWLDCVVLDPDKPEVGACFDVADPHTEHCNPLAGGACPAGLACGGIGGEGEQTPSPGDAGDSPAGGGGICTSFCSIGESVCPEGLECTPTEDGVVEWGMCLPKDDVPECWDDSNCEGLAVCVTLADGFSGCVPLCVEEGEPCEDFGQCVAWPGPAGETISCLDVQGTGEICNSEKGLPCAAGLDCTDVPGDAIWKHCTTPCKAGVCDAPLACLTGEGIAPAGLCVPPALALPEPEQCNASYPCGTPSHICVPVPGGAKGVCAPPCSAGCPAGTSCKDGGCVKAAPAGAPCLPDKGLFCAGSSACLKDEGETGEGMCAVQCDVQDPDACEAPQTCVELGAPSDAGDAPSDAGDATGFCLQLMWPGEKCSVDEGKVCDAAAGQACVRMAAGADFGYCAAKCDGPGSGTCTGEDPLLPECIVKKGAQYYCGYLCGMAGAECPPDLSCSGLGVCVP